MTAPPGRDAASDTGPVHADRWFWDLGHGATPPGVERVKVWVAVVTEPGLSGLRVLRGSHLREWRYHGEPRDGFVKPAIDEDVDALGLDLVRTEPGDAVVFNDALLHGGGESLGAWTRVSFEMTMFVRRRQAR
jgi:ectoine hydroxylase-related dioxygenase (phytanoyl-CoA dioxygenase family)